VPSITERNSVFGRISTQVLSGNAGSYPSQHLIPSTSTAVIVQHHRTLSELRAGESAVIHKLLGTTITRLHLMEMGLTPGTELKVVRVGAFGGPLDIMVRGYRLSIRRDEARSIELNTKEGE
jgi:Fe2+ transport system protein FeoA